MPQATLDDVMEELRSQREEIERLRTELRKATAGLSQELIRVQDLADTLGLARSTIYKRANKKGIPVRGKNGFPKEEGDKSAAYISRTEWESAEAASTQTVRHRAGFYD